MIYTLNPFLSDNHQSQIAIHLEGCGEHNRQSPCKCKVLAALTVIKMTQTVAYTSLNLSVKQH